MKIPPVDRAHARYWKMSRKYKRLDARRSRPRTLNRLRMRLVYLWERLSIMRGAK